MSCGYSLFASKTLHAYRNTRPLTKDDLRDVDTIDLLSTGQRAAVAAKWVEYFAVEAKKRRIAAQNNDAGRAVSANLHEQDSGRSAR